MKIRADIAALIHAGRTDVEIASELGCHRTTAHRARQALADASLQATARIFAEELPTGRVTEYRPASQPISPAQAAANRARLEAALREDRTTSRLTPVYRHLHAAPAANTRKAAA